MDEFVKDRASRSLAHTFTLLSLVLRPEPLRIAFRGLHTDDPNLRGTALEYLEGVLPPAIRERLWPFLEDPRPAANRTIRQRDEILADLLRSNASITLNLKELQRRDEHASSKSWHPKSHGAADFRRRPIDLEKDPKAVRRTPRSCCESPMTARVRGMEPGGGEGLVGTASARADGPLIGSDEQAEMVHA